jgi:hypothetical protein
VHRSSIIAPSVGRSLPLFEIIPLFEALNALHPRFSELADPTN